VPARGWVFRLTLISRPRSKLGRKRGRRSRPGTPYPSSVQRLAQDMPMIPRQEPLREASSRRLPPSLLPTDVEAEELGDLGHKRAQQARLFARELGLLLAGESVTDQLAAQPVEGLWRDALGRGVYEGE